MRITRAAADTIVAHARAEAPNECCGLLIGSGDSIEDAVPTRNADASPSRYTIEPADHFALVRRVRQDGRTILGAYHSHPATAASPSPTDVAQAYDEQLVYVIVSIADVRRADIRGYRISGGEFREVPLVTVS